MRKFVGTV